MTVVRETGTNVPETSRRNEQETGTNVPAKHSPKNLLVAGSEQEKPKPPPTYRLRPVGAGTRSPAACATLCRVLPGRLAYIQQTKQGGKEANLQVSEYVLRGERKLGGILYATKAAGQITHAHGNRYKKGFSAVLCG
jgi:hypothetical protein